MTEDTTGKFLGRLWQLQAEAGLRDADLARILGCDPSYVRHLKAGRRKRLGLPIALRATVRWPELRSILVAEFPLGTDNVRPSNDAEGQEGQGQ